jgi:hypothetical protein
VLSEALHIGNRHEAVKKTVDLFVDRIIEAVNRVEHPPAFWFVVIPELVYQLGRPKSIVPVAERTTSAVTVSQTRAPSRGAADALR